MSLEKFLDTRLLRNLRDMVATARAVMFVGAVSITGVALVGLALRYLVDDPFVALVLGGTFLILTATSIYAWYYVTRVYDPAFYEIPELESLVVIEPVGAHHRYTYERRQKVRATRNNLRLIEFRAHWTGVGSRNTMRVEPLVTHHVLLDGHVSEEGPRVYRWVYPRRAIDRGQTIDIGIRQVHEDDIQQQQPYYREGGGRYRTQRLIVVTRFTLAEEPLLNIEPEGGIWDANRPTLAE